MGRWGGISSLYQRLNHFIKLCIKLIFHKRVERPNEKS
jgi:hypothetical protein